MNATSNDSAHGRRITDIVENVHGAGPHRCVAVEQAAVRLYKEALIRRMEEKGGLLDADDLEAIARSYVSDAPGLSLLAIRSYSACTEAAREAIHDGQRIDPFGRLIIETFGHLLAGRSERGDTSIERTHLPNLFKVFRAMLGEETIWGRRQACQTILNELRFKHGDDFSWRLYYDDDRSKRILAETVVDFVAHFSEFDHRIRWFLDVMNSRPPSAAREDGTNRATDFCEAHIYRIAHSMITATGPHLETSIERRSDKTEVPFRQIIARFTAGYDKLKPVQSAEPNLRERETGSWPRSDRPPSRASSIPAMPRN